MTIGIKCFVFLFLKKRWKPSSLKSVHVPVVVEDWNQFSPSLFLLKSHIRKLYPSPPSNNKTNDSSPLTTGVWEHGCVSHERKVICGNAANWTYSADVSFYCKPSFVIDPLLRKKTATDSIVPCHLTLRNPIRLHCKIPIVHVHINLTYGADRCSSWCSTVCIWFCYCCMKSQELRESQPHANMFLLLRSYSLHHVVWVINNCFFPFCKYDLVCWNFCVTPVSSCVSASFTSTSLSMEDTGLHMY